MKTLEKVIAAKMGEKGQNFRGLYQGFQYPWNKKPIYAFGKTDEELQANISRLMNEELQRKARQNERAAERRAEDKAGREQAAKEIQPGMIFYASWGYDQTNVDFYKITEIHGKMATLQAIGQKTTETTGWASERVTADPDRILPEPPMKRLIQQGYNKKPAFSGKHSYHSLSLWDGSPLHQSHYA